MWLCDRHHRTGRGCAVTMVGMPLRQNSRRWLEPGRARHLSRRAVTRARIQVFVLLPLLAGVLVFYEERHRVLDRVWDTPVQIATAVALLILGWQIALDVGRSLGPALFRRLEPGTAGTAGFLIRLVTIAVAVIVALRVAGLDPRTLAVGGAFTAVIVGLAAQQTLGNLIAGTVLLSARPFRVGDRVRLQGGGLAGQAEGVVSELGLLYTTFARGDDHMLVPNSVVLSVAILPLREPDGVDLRARFPARTTPSAVQELLEERVSTPTRDRPSVRLEELDGDDVIMRIAAVPEVAADGPRLAGEVLDAIGARAAA